MARCAGRSRSRARSGPRRRRVTRRRPPPRGSAAGRGERQARVGYILDGAHWKLSDPMSIPSLILAHAYLTLVSVGIGLLIAFPIGLLIARTRPANASIFDPSRLYAPVVGVAGFLYTIPSLAFVAFL